MRAIANNSKNSAAWSAGAILTCAVLLNGCASTPVVTRDTTLEANEGLVAVRVVDLGTVGVAQFSVQSEATGEIYPLQSIHFGQTTTATFVGRLPAGRYQPTQLVGWSYSYGRSERVEVPLENVTGKFDVAVGRATQLGSIAYVPIPGTNSASTVSYGTLEHSFKFALSLIPTPVPVEPMLAARFPELAKTSTGAPPLGWVDGTLPPQDPTAMAIARTLVRPTGQPTFLDADTYLTGGALGVIREKKLNGNGTRYAANTVHAITTVLPLEDGRWLAGGEEGYLAMSINHGKEWKPLPPLAPDEIVLFMTQREDTQLFMVTDSEREVVVYESSDNPIAWKEIKRIPSRRETRFVIQAIGENAHFLPDFAAASKERLVVLSRPDTISSFDFRTREWQSFEIPRTFQGGFKITPDGYIVGIASLYWIYGSHDYGKSWTRLEAFMHMTEPQFFDHKRGVMLAADFKLQPGSPYQVRTTNDGGLTWKTGATVKDWTTGGGPVPWSPDRPVRPLWSNPAGNVLYMSDLNGRVSVSRDGGRTWQEE